MSRRNQVQRGVDKAFRVAGDLLFEVDVTVETDGVMDLSTSTISTTLINYKLTCVLIKEEVPESDPKLTKVSFLCKAKDLDNAQRGGFFMWRGGRYEVAPIKDYNGFTFTFSGTREVG